MAQYSARGELLRVALGDGTEVTYSYDGLGRRVTRNGATGKHQFLYGNPSDPVQVTATVNQSGELSEYFYDENGLLLAFRRGGSLFYVATDQVGTPRVVCDPTGQILKVLEYDSFGNLVSDSNPGFDLPLSFAGGLLDTATGLVRFGFRDYDPRAGRWTARDPSLFEGGQINLYLYVENDPVNFRDPDGRDMREAVQRAIEGYFGKPPELPFSPSGQKVLKTFYKYWQNKPINPLPGPGFAFKVGTFYGRLYYEFYRRLSDCLATV